MFTRQNTPKSEQGGAVSGLWSQIRRWFDLSEYNPEDRARRLRNRQIGAIIVFAFSVLLTQLGEEQNISWLITLLGGAVLIFGVWGGWLRSTEIDPDRLFRDRTLRATVLSVAVLSLSYLLEPLYHGMVSGTIPDFIGSALAVGFTIVALNAGRINIANAVIFIFPVEFLIYWQLSSGYWDTFITVFLVTLVVISLLISGIRLGIVVSLVFFMFYAATSIINPTHLVNPLNPTNYAKDIPLDLTTTAVVIAIVTLVTSYVSRELDQRRKTLSELVNTLEARVAARTRDLEVAADVSRQVVSDLNLSTLLVNLVERTRAAFNLRIVTLYNFDIGSQTLSFAAGTAAVTGELSALATEAAKTCKPTLANHVLIDQSELALPLLVASELLAVLHLQADKANRFSEADVKVLETLTNQLAIAIRNARSFANETTLRQESELLFKISESVNSATTFQSLVDSAVKLVEVRPYDVTLSFYEHFDLNKATYTETVAILPAGQLHAIANVSRESVFVPDDLPQRLYVIEDTANPPPKYAEMAAFYAARGFKALLLVYLKLGEQIIGMITFKSPTAYHFLPAEIRVVQGIADILVSAAERIRLYNDQVQMTEQLRTLDTLKSQFLASMSHELRTPLNAILNFTEFVSIGMLGAVNDGQRDALNKSLESGRHLLSLINDVLDITKIEANMMTLFIEDDLELPTLLDAVVATTQPLLADKPVQLILDIDANLPLMIGDKRRIRQILLNLMSNAAKFTAEGSITLSVKNQQDNVLFAVIDTGPGIVAADQQVIFEPFRQSDLGLMQAGGTGLGLPISKRLAEAHGGKLWVESEVGEGAAFYVLLPVRSEQLMQLLLAATPAPTMMESAS
jgi:signal transduction histidine kinase